MRMTRPGRIFCTAVLLVFCVFIFRGTLLAKRPPNTINLKVKVQAKFRWKKQGNKITPVEMIIKGKSYKFVKQGGQWGVKAPLKELIKSSPEVNNAFHLAVGEIAMTRIRDIVKGDRGKAEKLVKDYKALKKTPIPEEFPSVRGPAVEDSELDGMAAILGGGDLTQNQMQNAYNQTVNGEAFFYPVPQPGLGGWDLVSEDEGGGEEEGEDEGGGFFSWLATVFCVLVCIVAPIVAAVWLAAAAITIAAVTTAVLGVVGALGVAGIIGSTLNVVDDIINGRPLIQIWN